VLTDASSLGGKVIIDAADMTGADRLSLRQLAAEFPGGRCPGREAATSDPLTAPFEKLRDHATDDPAFFFDHLSRGVPGGHELAGRGSQMPGPRAAGSSAGGSTASTRSTSSG